MTDHQYSQPYEQQGYPPQQYTDPAAQQPYPAQYADPIGQQPAPALARRKRNPLLIAGIATLATLLVLGLGGYTVWANFIREDPGIAACKAMRDNGDSIRGAQQTSTNGSGKDKKWTEAEYLQVRKQFGDSDYPKIREHGTALIDLAWQMQQLPAGQEMGALAFLAPLGTHISGLQTACADQGIIVNLSK